VIQLNGLSPPHFCVGPKSGPEFSTSYVVVFYVLSECRKVICTVVTKGN
jgi:hypothetical protein